MKARVYQRCPLCARVTPLDAMMARCPHDGAVMLTQCRSCGSKISSLFVTHCGVCGAVYLLAQTGYSSQVKTPP